MDASTISPEKALEQLQTIKNFFEEGQKNLSENGKIFMFWGILIPLATGVFYWLANSFGYGSLYVTIFWPVITLFGAIVSWVVGYTSAMRSRTKGYALKIKSLMWVGFLITIAVLFLSQLRSGTGFHPIFLCHIALLLGLAYWIHGSMIQLPWFRYVAIVWWLTAVAIAGMDWFMASICLSLATFICSFIPGLVLFRSKANRSQANRST